MDFLGSELLVDVSVIIPVYNAELFIEGTVEEVFKQTIDNLEVICIDDGSTDKTLSVLNNLKTVYKNLKVYHKENGGAGSARNLGIGNAAGKYVFFLDADDRMYDYTVLERLFNAAIENSTSICGGDIYLLKDEKVTKEENACFQEEGFLDFFEYQNIFYFFRYMYNRDFLLKNQIAFQEIYIYEDPVFLLHTMIAAERFYYFNIPVYIWNVAHQKSIKRNVAQTIDYLKGITECLRLSSEHSLNKIHTDNYRMLIYQASPDAENLMPQNNIKLFNALIKANDALDIDILRADGIESESGIFLPSLELVWNCSNKYLKIRHSSFFNFLVRIKRLFNR